MSASSRRSIRLLSAFPWRRGVALTALVTLTLAEARAASAQLPPPPAPLRAVTPSPTPASVEELAPETVTPRGRATPTVPPTVPPTVTPRPRPSPTAAPTTPSPTAPAAAPGESALRIDHAPLRCITTDAMPEVDAAVRPGPNLSRGYVFFRAANSRPSFYYVLMEGDPGTLAANLPRPLPDTKAVDYYVQAVDRIELRKKTPQYTPHVEAGTSCRSKATPVGESGGGLTVGLTEQNQDPVPAGFNKADIANVILASGEVVALAAALKLSGGGAGAAGGGASSGAAAGGGGAAGGAAAGGAAGAATGGGISTGVLIVGGVVLVGAGVAVAASGGGKGGGSQPGNTPTPTNTPPATATNTPVPTATPTRTPTVTPTTPPSVLRFIEVDVIWSGPGAELTAQIIGPGGTPVGQRVAHTGCGPQSARIDRVLEQGTNLPSGTYTPQVTAALCQGEPVVSAVTGVLSVVTEAGVRCTNRFFTIAVAGQTVRFSDCQAQVP